MVYNKEIIEVVTRLVIESLHKYQEVKTEVPVGISARHVHLTREHVDRLFGQGYQLTHFKPLSQPGQFAANETVDLVGPKGTIGKVRVLGPERPHTQIEVPRSDARKLGVNPPVKTSGDINTTPGIVLRGPKGEVTLSQGVIIADRHIHMTPEDAISFRVKDGEKVHLQVEGDKGGILHNVSIRVSPNYALDCHIDTDDASAFQIQQGQIVTIIKDNVKQKGREG